jgi:lipopolysaccharide export LptBFGC system permease protein LptF
MIPGGALHRLAGRMCSAKTLERVVEPAIADLQREYADGTGDRSALARLWALRGGYIAVLEVIFMCAVDLLPVTREDRKALIRTVSWAAGGVVSALAGLIVLGLAQIAYVGLSFLTHVGYVIPQALPLALPIGLTFGIAFGLNGVVVSHRTRKVVLLAALVASAAAFGTIGWVMPQANESYRQALDHARSGRDVWAKGPDEMTFGELRQLSSHARDSGHLEMARSVDWHYHVRPALSLASVVLALFALVLSAWHAGALRAVAMAACAMYFLLLFVGHMLTFDGLPPIAGAWLPNVLFAVATYFMWSRPSSVQSSPTPAQ